MNIKLKDHFADRQIGFNNSMAPLGERNDLDKLLIQAHRSGRQDYLDMFDNPPTLEELLIAEADAKLEASLPYQAPAAYPESPATDLAPDLKTGTEDTPAQGTTPGDEAAQKAVTEASDTKGAGGKTGKAGK